MTKPRPPRTPADAARRAGQPLPKPAAAGKPRQMDLYHMLSAVVGSLAGLVFYSVITPGHLPDAPVVERRDPRLDVLLHEVSGRMGADGYFHVGGQVVNAREGAAKRVTVGVSFKDEASKELSRAIATVDDVPGRGRKPFEVRAYAPGARVFETTVDLAQF